MMCLQDGWPKPRRSVLLKLFYIIMSCSVLLSSMYCSVHVIILYALPCIPCILLLCSVLYIISCHVMLCNIILVVVFYIMHYIIHYTFYIYTLYVYTLYYIIRHTLYYTSYSMLYVMSCSMLRGHLPGVQAGHGRGAGRRRAGLHQEGC